MNYLEKSNAIKEEMIEYRRNLHRFPELGMNLPYATKLVMDTLKSFGYLPVELEHGGVTATVGSGNKCFLLRADMDALPMQEESGLPYSSTIPNVAHTCGHDMHTAMLLGAAKLLKENEESLNGVVKLMFQPGEETLEGAASMIKDGILEGPKVNAAMALHMIPMVPTGMVIYGKGVVSASCDIIKITVTGKGGHGAHPKDSVDPINVAAHIHIALQELLSREIDQADSAVLTFGTFHSGSKENIIPDEAVMTGTLRTYDKNVRNFIVQRMDDMSKMIANAFRAKATVELEGSVCPLMADGDVVDCMDAAFKAMLPQGTTLMQNKRQSGSEDFAFVADAVPSMCFVLGGGSPQQGYTHGIHHCKTMYDENCLPVGAAAYAQGATCWLAQNK